MRRFSYWLSAFSYQLTAGGLLGLAVSLPPSSLAAEPPSRQAAEPPSRRAAEPGSELTVTLVTYEQGERVYERYGHNAIWIHDAATGTDEHYDYGRFDFNAPGFVLNFVRGKMWYSMGFESNVPGMMEIYVRQGRTVWAQELNIPPAERIKLREFLAWNYRPENRDYPYDYYLDNCSTRIRDALDSALGGALRRYGQQRSGWSWRDETRRLNQHNKPLYTGLLVMLGQPVDAEMSRWERMFLPVRLREYLNDVSVPGPNGELRPAVLSEQLIAESGRWPVPERPGNWLPAYLVAGLLAGALMALVGRTRAFVPVAVLWLLPVGLLGAFMTWVWIGSYHLAGYRNENLFLMNLLALALAVILPQAARGKGWALGPSRWLAAAVAGVGALGLVGKVLPWFPQQNLEVIALVLPVHLAVWLGTVSRFPPPRTP